MIRDNHAPHPVEPSLRQPAPMSIFFPELSGGSQFSVVGLAISEVRAVQFTEIISLGYYTISFNNSS